MSGVSLRTPCFIQVHFGAVSPVLQRQQRAGKAMPWQCFSFGYARVWICSSTEPLHPLCYTVVGKINRSSSVGCV